MKDIVNYNNRGQYHGYQEWYNWPGKLRFRGNYMNGKRDGYREWYNYPDGKIERLTFFIL